MSFLSDLFKTTTSTLTNPLGSIPGIGSIKIANPTNFSDLRNTIKGLTTTIPGVNLISNNIPIGGTPP